MRSHHKRVYKLKKTFKSLRCSICKWVWTQLRLLNKVAVIDGGFVGVVLKQPISQPDLCIKGLKKRESNPQIRWMNFDLFYTWPRLFSDKSKSAQFEWSFKLVLRSWRKNGDRKIRTAMISRSLGIGMIGVGSVISRINTNSTQISIARTTATVILACHRSQQCWNRTCSTFCSSYQLYAFVLLTFCAIYLEKFTCISHE